MKNTELPIVTPCGADWSKMTLSEAKRRLCGDCDKHVHDVSAMSENEARAVVANGPACVRYLYDRHGRILFGALPEGARVVPASALLSKAARNRWLAVAAMVAAPLVFEACGGADNFGRASPMERFDAGDSTGDDSDRDRVPARPGLDAPDASVDASDDGG